jgi:hypothetical protein
VLLEKPILNYVQLVKKFTAFYGTRAYIIFYSISQISILILSTHLLLVLPGVSLPFRVPNQNLYASHITPCLPHAPSVTSSFS